MSINLTQPITFTNTTFISTINTNLSILNQPAIVIFNTFPENNTEDRDLYGLAGENHLVKIMTAGLDGNFSQMPLGSYYIFGPITKIGNTYSADLTTGGETIDIIEDQTGYTSDGIYVGYLLPQVPSSIAVQGVVTNDTIYQYNGPPFFPDNSPFTINISGVDTCNVTLGSISNDYAIPGGLIYLYGPIDTLNSLASLVDLYIGGDESINAQRNSISAPKGGSYVLFNFIPICFLKGTPVETDQGEVEIDKLVPDINTINGKRIIKVVETYGNSTCLRLIKRDLISSDVPNKDTVITKWHKVLFNGKLVRAKDLPGIHVCQYNGDALYNVLMDEHDMMKVNGMTVETLDPAHKINK
jgi:hypothetical protein